MTTYRGLTTNQRSDLRIILLGGYSPHILENDVRDNHVGLQGQVSHSISKMKPDLGRLVINNPEDYVLTGYWLQRVKFF